MHIWKWLSHKFKNEQWQWAVDTLPASRKRSESTVSLCWDVLELAAYSLVVNLVLMLSIVWAPYFIRNAPFSFSQHTQCIDAGRQRNAENSSKCNWHWDSVVEMWIYTFKENEYFFYFHSVRAFLSEIDDNHNHQHSQLIDVNCRRHCNIIQLMYSLSE